MAEAKAIADLYFQQRGFNVALSAPAAAAAAAAAASRSRTSSSSESNQAEEEDVDAAQFLQQRDEYLLRYEIQLRIPVVIPTPRTLGRWILSRLRSTWQASGGQLQGLASRQGGEDTEEAGLKRRSPFLPGREGVVGELLWNLRYAFWPAAPSSAFGFTAAVTFLTLQADSSSWLRNGFLASFLWNFDERLNPFQSRLSISARVAYLAASCALVVFYLLTVLRRIFLRFLLTWGWWLRAHLGKYPLMIPAWVSMVRIVSGNSRITSGYQRSLPILPLPKLEDTCRRYLLSVRPVLSSETSDPNNFERVKKMVRRFLEREGPNLQLYLWTRSLIYDNYVSDLWTEFVYLRSRAPLMINSNYYVLDDPKAKRTSNQVFRAANLSHHFLVFKDMIENETLEPLLVGSVMPLCMHQYRTMFGTTRIPGVHGDTLKHTERSRHIIVFRRGRFYALNVYHENGDLYTPAELAHQLQLIKEHANLDATGGISDETRKVTRISSDQNISSLSRKASQSGTRFGQTLNEETLLPAFTTCNRAKWAEIRHEYFSHGVNKAAIELIDTAAFVLVLDSLRPEGDIVVQSKALLHGDGNSRWFDKNLNLIVFEDGSAGLNAEHAWGDAPVVAHLWEHANLSEIYDVQIGRDAASLAHEPLSGSPLPMPERLVWDFEGNAKIEALATQAISDAQFLINDLDLDILEFSDFGKHYMRSHGIHPDSFVQLALQLAYVRDQGQKKMPLTYEACMTRLFRKGRTETVRAFTNEGREFIHLMLQNDELAEPSTFPNLPQIQEALKRAVDRHQRLYKDAMEGHGVDRHLFALYVMAQYLGTESPFLDFAMSQRWNLSTSQQPQIQTKLRERIDPEVAATFASPGGGFGPVDDYGVSYMIIHDSKLFFHVSGRRSKFPQTSAIRFIGEISRALMDLKQVVQSMSSSSA